MSLSFDANCAAFVPYPTSNVPIRAGGSAAHHSLRGCRPAAFESRPRPYREVKHAAHFRTAFGVPGITCFVDYSDRFD